MKISLALGQRQTLSRQTAWGCLTTNLAFPGSGSLIAGYRSGYFQAALAIGGMLITGVFGIRFIAWYLSNWSKFFGPQADPFPLMGEMWLRIRWALAGIGVFALGGLWALTTSLRIVNEAKKGAPPSAPPPLINAPPRV